MESIASVESMPAVFWGEFPRKTGLVRLGSSTSRRS
jgi:hypothetical protein